MQRREQTFANVARVRRLAPLWLFLFCAFLLLTSREPPWADAHVTYATTQALVDRGALDVHLDAGPPWLYAVRDGKRYGVFPLGNVFAMVPSYLSYKVLSHIKRLPEPALHAFTCHVAPALMMAGACTLFFALCRRRTHSERAALWLTFVLAFCTLLFVYARSPYSEAVQTLALLWVVERTLDQGEDLSLLGMAWLAFAGGVLFNTKLVYALMFPSIFVYLLLQARTQQRVRLFVQALPIVIGVFSFFVAIALWHNHMKTGTLADSGYRIRDGIFSGDLLAGLYGLLLSSGKGVFLYSPPLLFALAGITTAFATRRRETVLLVSIVVIDVLFNAKFRHWHADYCWGPRHLMSVIPVFFLLAAPWIETYWTRGRLQRSVVYGVCATGLAIQLLGASIYWDQYIRVLIAVKEQERATPWFQEDLTHGHFIPRYSPLVGQMWLLRHVVKQDPNLAADAPFHRLAPEANNFDDAYHRARLDWWALDWFTPGPSYAPRPGAVLVALLLFGMLAGGVLVGRRRAEI